jgi:hypothetical protein
LAKAKQILFSCHNFAENDRLTQGLPKLAISCSESFYGNAGTPSVISTVDGQRAPCISGVHEFLHAA